MGAVNSFALKRDGTLWSWGMDPISGGTKDDLAPTQIDPATNWAAVVAGEFHLLALKTDGTLWIRGQNALIITAWSASGPITNLVQIGDGRDWSEVYSGAAHFIARKADGSWWACGVNTKGQLGLGRQHLGFVGMPERLPIDFEPWAFAAGSGNNLLLAQDGTLWSWGNRLGAPGTPKGFRTMKKTLNAVVPGGFPFFPWPQMLVDLSPRKIWGMPAEMKLRLSDSAPAAPSPGQPRDGSRD